MVHFLRTILPYRPAVRVVVYCASLCMHIPVVSKGSNFFILYTVGRSAVSKNLLDRVGDGTGTVPLRQLYSAGPLTANFYRMITMSKRLRVYLAPAMTFAVIFIALLIQPLSPKVAATSYPDFDNSGNVDFTDFLLFVGAFGSREGQEGYDTKYDLNSDGEIGFADFLIFANSFGRTEEFLRNATTYQQFVKDKENGTEPILPDFSYAGYHYFTKPIPDVAHPIFDVTDYGAIPNDDVSDQPAIVSAIAAAEENGRGIVFFPPGEFLVATDADINATGNNSPIRITGSNIVLRGSGSRDGGTIIRQVNQAIAANEPWGVWWAISFQSPSGSREVTRVTTNANRESHWITVESTARLSVGQWVRLRMANKTDAVIKEYLAPRDMNDFSSYYQNKLRDGGIVINEIHQIAEISGNRVRFHTPIRTPINATHDFTIHTFSYLEEVGVEDICFQGSFLEKYTHSFGNTDLSMERRSLWFGGYSLVQFNRCVNSWMRRCSFINVVRGYRAVSSANLSFYQITTAGNRGHYSVVLENANSIWIGLTEDIADAWHGTSITHNASGNVFYHSDMVSTQEIDTHRTSPSYDNLWDRCSGGHLKGSSGGSAPPHHLNRLVLWNYNRLALFKNGSYSFWQFPTWWLKPIIVGIHGIDGPVGSDTRILESQGTPVEPGSLFEAQLELRLGSVPVWLKDLHTEWATLRNMPLPK